MASIPKYLSSVSGLAGGSPDTGELRRKFNFAERFSELAVEQTPFFRLVSKVGKRPTDDPQFKFTEKRHSWHKRYAYVLGIDGDAGGACDIDDADLTESDGSALSGGGTIKVYMATDYKSAGNIQNIYGSGSNFEVGAEGTRPQFFLPKQIIRIPLSATANGSAVVADYVLAQVVSVASADVNISSLSASDNTAAETVLLTCQVLRIPADAANNALTSYADNVPVVDVGSKVIHKELEAMRSYVVGSTYEEGSSLLDESWMDNPYSTGYGRTQIFRTEFGMTNTMRATMLKYEPNEWARVWKDRLVDHKWDIEYAGLFGKQGTASVDSGSGAKTHYYTQGAVDYILNNGNIFSLDHATKSADDFLDDMSSYIDPRYNSSKATVFFCDTETYNWLHKLSGYFANNLGKVVPGQAADTVANSATSMARSDFSASGRGKAFGVDLTSISTIYGDMKVSRCIAMDGSGIKILAVNMGNVAYRPLVGNGVNRDTSVYVGVQSLENTGTDKRVDMILTEAGFEWKMPESHALWK